MIEIDEAVSRNGVFSRPPASELEVTERPVLLLPRDRGKVPGNPSLCGQVLRVGLLLLAHLLGDGVLPSPRGGQR